MSESSLRRSDAERNRGALLDAAARLLVTDPDASLEAIAREAGLSRRAVYGHYANRDELVVAAIERGARRLIGVGDGIELSDPPVALATLGARLWDAVEHVRVIASFTLRGPHVRRVGQVLAPLREVVARILEAGVADGSLRADVPVPVLAHLVEQSAIAVLTEATENDLSREEGHRLVMLMALSTAGLSAQAAGSLIDATPSLRTPTVSGGEDA
ncbi:TetR/AcrR family transcriptional regulator [Rathayibacter sp. YIM 133350]|uniref:TetR/AcrR family transcriptional regulator n=1 Tax=Rathayibacter sp. YIM 133350 TaxID=3131992 RepID=UPI00307D2CBB